MNPDSAIGLIGALGVLILVLLGLTLIVRGTLPGFRGGTGALTAPISFGRGVLGRSLASLLSFVVVYKFFFERYTAGVLGPETMLGIAVVVLAAMALVPPVEILVSLTALIVFLIDNTAVFGGAAIGTFLLLGLLYVPIRWFLGR